ncbi:GH92 family glycosyl hydrolase [Mucilaginibacter koreensis]
MKKIIFTGLMLAAMVQVRAQQTSYAAKVNTLIGTKGKGFGTAERYLEAGYTFPGAMVPFGMVQFTPTFFNEDKGFVVNQLSGAGCDHMGNFPTLPLTGALTKSPDDMSGFKPGYYDKTTIAGYYKTQLNNNILCELTTTKRTGMAQYTYPAGQKLATIIIGSGVNATQLSEAEIKFTGANTLEGYADGGSFCSPQIKTNYKVYFVAAFDTRPVNAGTWKDKKLSSDKNSNGANSGAYLTFNVAANKVIRYKFAISYVSLGNARQNLKAENAGWQFEQVKNNAIAAWNHYLAKIQVSGSTADHTTQFYTHLYHALAHPSLFSDVNGQYIGGDRKMHTAKGFNYYTAFSNWDTYRTQVQLMSLLAPKETGDMMNSIITFAQQSGGGFPRWVMADVETGIMQGDPTSILVANAYAFGVRNFNTKAALEVMRRGADDPNAKSQDILTRPQLAQYLQKGYADASMSLEYNSADFAIGQFILQTTGDKTLALTYLNRAQSWKNLYNPATGWLQSRRADGSWKRQDEDWREAGYKNYFWMVPFDLKGLIDTIGGKHAAEARLDSFFVKLNANYGQTWFAAGNEPDFEVPWVYNWAGAPYKTQEVVRRIIKEQYTNRPGGLPGNDDLGAMGAWYVFANIGLYPIVPGYGGFSLNSPGFNEIRLQLGSGKWLTIKGGSDKKPYIAQLMLNGKKWENTWLPYSIIKNGGQLQYQLSSVPNTTWATKEQPPSFR